MGHDRRAVWMLGQGNGKAEPATGCPDEVKDGGKGDADRLVYSKSTHIDDWRDGLPVYFGGVKIPFEDMDVSASDGELGIVRVKMTLPNGRNLEAEDGSVRIKPEPQ